MPCEAISRESRYVEVKLGQEVGPTVRKALQMGSAGGESG